MNTLTPAEKAEGWRLLFDGECLEHWRGYRHVTVPEAWTVSDGSIHCPGANAGDLLTRETFQNFELKLDWKISSGGNSGIFFHVAEHRQRTWETGPEIQILDDARHPDAQRGAVFRNGANYGLHPPARQVACPPGAWHQAYLLVQGSHVEYGLNGEPVVAYELWSADWERRVASSKFADVPDYGRMKTGHIALQDHGDPVWFRHVRVRLL